MRRGMHDVAATARFRRTLVAGGAVCGGRWGEGAIVEISSWFLQDLQSEVEKEQMVKSYEGVKSEKLP